MRLGSFLAAASAALLVGSAALAADPASADLVIDGGVAHASHLSLDALKALPATSIDATFQTGHGTMAGHYTGVLLWTLIDKAQIPAEKNEHHLQHSVIVTGSDGYEVAVAIGEIAPDFENKQVLIAYERDGKPEKGLRLVVPGDAKGGRSVHDVVHIELR